MVYEFVPGFFLMHTQDVVVMAVQGDVVLLNVIEQIVCAQNLGNLHELIVVVLALEKRFLLENHSGKHATERPNVERVVVSLQVNEQLRTFKISGCHSDIVLLLRMVKLRESPIDETQSLISVVNHNVMGFHISMHDSF